MSRAQRIAAYLASNTEKPYAEWLAEQDHPQRLAGKAWPLGAIALFVLTCLAAAVALITVAVKARPGVQ
jgi:hypothetical protein